MGTLTASAADRMVITDDMAVMEYTGEGVMDFVIAADLPLGWGLAPAETHPDGTTVTLPVDGAFQVASFTDGTLPQLVGGDILATGPALTLFMADVEEELNHLTMAFSSYGGGVMLYGSDMGPGWGRPIFSIGEVTVDVISASEVVLEAPVFLNAKAAAGLNVPEYTDTQIGSIVFSGDSLSSKEVDFAVPGEGVSSGSGVVAASGNGPGGGPSGPDGSDIYVWSIDGSSISKYGTIDGVTAYAMSTTSCNEGDEWAVWLSNVNQHPLVSQNLFRITDGRFEQIGMAWLKHTWCAADFSSCGTGSPNGTCSYMTIGIYDTYSAGLNAAQDDLGPRSDVRAASGEYPYPYSIAFGQTGNSIYKRMQVQNTDLAGSTGANGTDTRYLAEAYYITSDEPINDTDNPNANRQYDNASWKRVIRGNLSGGGYFLNMTGPTVQRQTALEAWPQFDLNPGDGYPPQVAAVSTPGEKFVMGSDAGVDAPNGRLYVGFDITPLPDGMWAYDYTIYNYNSDRSVREVTLNVAEADYTVATHHAPFYHSGDPQEGALGWGVTPDIENGKVSWATEPWTGTASEGGNELTANAIRWSTAHSFHIETTLPPDRAPLKLGLFRPGTPSQVEAQVFGPAPDCNDNEVADGIDIQDGTETDVNGNGIPDVCEADILILEGTATGSTAVELEVTGTVTDPFAIRLVGNGGDVDCVDGYVQADGTVDAAPVNQTVKEWGGTVVVSDDEIIPSSSYTATIEGAAANSVDLSTWDFGDVNNNQFTNLEDAQLAVIDFQNAGYTAAADVSPCGGDGLVNLADVQIIINLWQGTQTYGSLCGGPCP
jgi:hypothetical protein